MKLYFTTEYIDATITEIKQKLKLSMNGVTSDQMKSAGIHYRINYGVSIPRIKEIARDYQPNHDLAQRLWFLGIRETMILATILQPAETFNKNIAIEWISNFNQPEIVEQTCMNLLSKLPYWSELSMESIQSENRWIQVTGFTLAARNYQQLTDTDIHFMLKKSVELLPTNEFHLYKSIALFLSRLTRKGEEISAQITQKLALLPQNEVSVKYVTEQVMQEINFFG